MTTEEFKIPSGKIITIREMNGEDEIALSTQKIIETGNHLNIFLSRIIRKTSEELKDAEGNPKKYYSPEDIALWPLADKYYIALKARILSLGKDMVFKYKFQGEKTHDPEGHEYTEDLSRFLGNIDGYEHLTEDELKDYPADAFRPYPKGEQMVFTKQLHSGKTVEWSLLTSYGEKSLLQKLEGTLSMNDGILSRQLKVEKEGHFQLIENLREFSARELAELRAEFKKYDLNSTMPVEVTSPVSEKVVIIPAIGFQEFFFPTTVTF